MTVLAGIVLLLLIVLGVVALTTLAIVSLKRDRSHGTSGSMSSAMFEVQSLLEPEKKHTVEAKRQREECAEDDDSGGPD
ncbi:MAG TPA: hypothetical protein VEK57_30535 [Thermoanaerobaculia bacterium]|nr:hypothetical protein [Thermoanaerobaculia bacterium]